MVLFVLMRNLNIGHITSLQEEFISDRDWDQFHSIKNLSIALSVEASELAEIFQWMKEEDSNTVKIDPNLKAKVSDEIADIFLYLLRITTKAEIDLESAIISKLKKNADKYPIDKSRGNSKKYTDL